MKHRLLSHTFLLVVVGLLAAACLPVTSTTGNASVAATAGNAGAVRVDSARVEIGVGSPRPVTDFSPGATSGHGKPGLAALTRVVDEIDAVVNVDGLNLRIGPGRGHKIFRVLRYAQTLRLLGRSADSQWLEVRLPDGSGGWVYAAYVTAEAGLASLPVTEASGGPLQAPGAEATPFSCADTPWDLCMSIDDDQAVVYLQKYPRNAAVVVRLRLPGGGAEVEAARGLTDSSGAAQIVFTMPNYWLDGRPLTENGLVLVVSTAEGTFVRTASIRYVP